MKSALVLAALAVLVVWPLEPADAHAGYAASQHGASRSRHSRAQRPVIRPSSSKEPGGRCGQLNLERARLYGLCR